MTGQFTVNNNDLFQLNFSKFQPNSKELCLKIAYQFNKIGYNLFQVWNKVSNYSDEMKSMEITENN